MILSNSKQTRGHYMPHPVWYFLLSLLLSFASLLPLYKSKRRDLIEFAPQRPYRPNQWLEVIWPSTHGIWMVKENLLIGFIDKCFLETIPLPLLLDHRLTRTFTFYPFTSIPNAMLFLASNILFMAVVQELRKIRLVHHDLIVSNPCGWWRLGNDDRTICLLLVLDEFLLHPTKFGDHYTLYFIAFRGLVWLDR